MISKDIKRILSVLNFNGVYFQDSLGLLLGIRPMIRFRVNKYSYIIFKYLCQKYKLNMIVYEYDFPKLAVVLIGRYNKRKLEKAKRADLVHDMRTMGSLLGYPDCCVSFLKGNYSDDKSLPLCTLFSDRKDKLSFLSNYLYNFDTRVSSGKMDNIRLLTENKYSYWRIYIIPHVPCSFFCGKTLGLAKDIWSAMEKEFPLTAKMIKDILSKPIVFWDDFEFIAVSGIVGKNTVDYTKVYNVNNLMNKEWIKNINKGDKLRSAYKKTLVFKKGKEIFNIGRKSHIFDFHDFL